MSDSPFMARFFLFGGALLVALSLLLWFILHIPGLFPPYLVTGLLSLIYGLFCTLTGTFARDKKS
jgi:hypothetical protein